MNCIKFCYHNYSLFFNSLFKKRWMRKGGGEEQKKKQVLLTQHNEGDENEIFINWNILAKWIIKLIFCN